MNTHVIEIEKPVLREARDLSLDTAARSAISELFAHVGAYLGAGVRYPREANIEFSWRQQDVTGPEETWVARAAIALHPTTQEVENPHAVPMDDRTSEQAGS